MTGSCECSNELLASIQCGEFLDRLPYAFPTKIPFRYVKSLSYIVPSYNHRIPVPTYATRVCQFSCNRILWTDYTRILGHNFVHKFTEEESPLSQGIPRVALLATILLVFQNLIPV